MNFPRIEEAKERFQAHQKMCEEYNQKREAAREEINQAKAEEQKLINEQLDGGKDVIDELAKAQARTRVTEAKYKRLIAEIGEDNPEIDLTGVSYTLISSGINLDAKKEMEEDMKDELKALKKAKEQYVQAFEKALVKFYFTRQELKEKIMEVENLFGEPAYGKLPIWCSESFLRPHGLWWDHSDAGNELHPIKQRAYEIGNGPIPELKGIKIDGVTTPEGPSEFTDSYGTTYTKIPKNVDHGTVLEEPEEWVDPYTGTIRTKIKK